MKRLRVAALGLLLFGCETTRHAKLTPLEEAQVLLSKGNGAQALERLQPLYAAHPRDLTLARAVAEAHVLIGDTQAFLAQLARRGDAVARYQEGLVRFASASDASGPAIAAFQAAVQLEPGEPEFRHRLGVALLESERYAQAAPHLESSSHDRPDRVGWLLPLAKVRARLGNASGAVEVLKTVVRRDLTSAELTVARALMDEIVDPFGELPRAARPKLEQAMQWLEVADVPQQAIDELTVLLAEFPDQGVLHALLGLAWARLDDAGRAVEELTRAIELSPSDGKNHLYLAALYDAKQRGAAAETHYRRAVELNPLLGEAWLRLGDAELERQNLARAREQYEVALRLSPGSASASGKLALVYQLEGDWPAADRTLRPVVDADPNNLEFMLRLGVLHTERFTKARSPSERETARAEATTWLMKVLEAQPENVLASRALERLKGR